MFPTFAAMSKQSVHIWIFSKIYLYAFVSFFIYVVLSTFICIVGDTYERLKVSLCTTRKDNVFSLPKFSLVYIYRIVNSWSANLYKFFSFSSEGLGANATDKNRNIYGGKSNRYEREKLYHQL